MAGADKGRRRELAPAARLVARAVTPTLYQLLGEPGLVGMDAERVKDRLATFAKVASTVESTLDAPGIIHLVTWLDDPEAVVRVAALDRLLRLSDVRKKFAMNWQLSAGALFPPAQCRWRFRRVLTRGTPDEQVSVLQLIASLGAKDLGDDVAAALLSPAPVVVETALETIGHFSGSDHQAHLLRLVADRQQPTPRRIKALEMVAKQGADGGGTAKVALRQRLVEQLGAIGLAGDDPAVRGPARKAQFTLETSAVKRRTIVSDLLKGDAVERRAGLELLHHTASDPYRYRTGTGNETTIYVDLALPFLFAEDQMELASLAANTLVTAMERSDQRTQVLALFEAPRKETLDAWCNRTDRPWPYHLALAIALGLCDHDRTLRLLAPLPPGESQHAWKEHLARTPDPLQVLRDALQVQPPAGTLPEAVADQILHHVVAQALVSPALLPSVLKAGALDALPGKAETDYGSGSGKQRTITKTFTLAQGRKLVLEGRPRVEADADSFSYDDEQQVWSVRGAVPATPDAAALSELAALLNDLRVGKDSTVLRTLVVSLVTGKEPDSAVVVVPDEHADLWDILGTIHADVRSRIIAAFTSAKEINSYHLQQFLVMGDPDLLDVVIAGIRKSDEEYEVERLVPYLTSLAPALVEPHLTTLLANRVAAGSDQVKALVKKIGRVPLSAALAVVAQGQALDGKIMPYGEAEVSALSSALSALTPALILSSTASLRVIREAAPASFDRVLLSEASRQDANGAAWLRGGLPMVAGMRVLYEQALAAEQPDVWLVGAAIALKEGRLDAPRFMAHLATLPAESLKDAALVATRYLQGKLADQDAALAQVVTRAPAPVLASWLPLLSPTPLVVQALTARVKDPTTADQLGFALAALLRSDYDGWLPPMKTIVAAAGGKMDYLLPAP